MYPFSFQNPTRIEFGLDKEKEMGKYMHEYGAKKALIIYGSERVKQSGLFEDVTKSLREHGIEYIECGGVKSNPTISKVREAGAMANNTAIAMLAFSKIFCFFVMFFSLLFL